LEREVQSSNSKLTFSLARHFKLVFPLKRKRFVCVWSLGCTTLTGKWSINKEFLL
jgi:hypothetical protein